MTTLAVTEHRIEAAGGSLYAKVWAYPNTASPIVLIHESLGSTRQWRQFPHDLAQATARTVISYDRLGYGLSTDYPGVQPTSFMLDEAAMFAQVRDALGFNEFMLLGHSVGGVMAAVMAAAKPTQCLGLITAGAPAYMEAKIRAGVLAAQAYFSDSAHFERLARHHQHKTEWVLNSWINNWLRKDFENWDIDQYLSQLACPILSIQGEHDEYNSAAQAQRYQGLSAYPNEIAVLSDCGHVPHLERPEPMIKAIKGFIQAQISAH